MCGIAGLWFRDPSRMPDRAQLTRMIGAIPHRGPDGTGYHIEPGVGLGHARLSIIDLGGGAQPIHNGDETVWITYNGEVFNYIELREELLARGHRFYTQSDTEVIVHAYDEYGDDFVRHLNGQFAFALWDRKRRRLLLVRDRAGILPLYHAEIKEGPAAGALVFGSEVKALIASGLVQPALDPDGLDELMTFWAPLAPRTIFAGVSQVGPGEMLVLDEKGMERRRYWHWEFPEAGALRREDPEKLKAELLDVLGDATQIRLRADVPVGAYLSGGLDSSTLVALLKQRVPNTLQTFSIGFDDAGLDESAHQREVVKHLDTKHNHVQCALADIARDFPRTIAHSESPVLRTAPAPMQMLSGLVRRNGVKVVLTGEGADEVLGGYDIFKESKVRQFWAQQPASTWRPGLLKRLYPYLDLTSEQSAAYLKEFFGVGLSNPNDPCFSHLPRWATTAQCKLFWSDDFRKRVSGDPAQRLRESLPKELAGWHPFNRSEYLEAKTLLPSYLLSSQGDRMLMSNSVEGRFPFLDHRLIEWATKLHPRYKMKVLREKWLLKEAMREKLPASILNRHKQPYRAPDAAAFLGPNTPEYVKELTSEAMIARFGYFDPVKVSRLMTKLGRSKGASARDNMAFIGVLSTQIWHATFVSGQAVG
ncbi:MAG: asparagine synthase (glutamine-hydrolyzing) [Steroidobacteraceae bacterium]|nr:asparagine synthase (glutamine-hydrolyzing) [Steroidobacteraceae bacterium]